MIEDGLFDGLDAALLFHPCDRNHVASIALASEDVDVVFHGLQAHAAADPWRGRNALDAMIQLFSAVGLWRQQLDPGNRVHGIIQEGGTAANIIPDRTKAWFMLRSPDQAEYERIKARFSEIVQGAALATDTTAEVTFSGGAMTIHPNGPLEARWVANAAAYGIVDEGPDPSAGSTDMGNVSWHCPTIHPELAIAPEGTAGHSTAFRDAAGTPAADRTTLLAATLVAQVAYELFQDPELVAAAWRDFRGAAAG
jgi:amidohydrolase